MSCFYHKKWYGCMVWDIYDGLGFVRKPLKYSFSSFPYESIHHSGLSNPFFIKIFYHSCTTICPTPFHSDWLSLKKKLIDVNRQKKNYLSYDLNGLKKKAISGVADTRWLAGNTEEAPHTCPRRQRLKERGRVWLTEQALRGKQCSQLLRAEL